jgi:phosphonoacetate hydrolase
LVRSRQRAVVAMIDGLDPSYVTPDAMPVFRRLADEGMFSLVDAVIPTVTNANNAGISCVAWPSEHGITGNYYYDPASGEQGYMEESRFLLRPTLMARVAAAGGKSALLTAKKKTASLLGDGTTLVVAAEQPEPELVARHGEPPGIYSAEINHWLWKVAVDLLETVRDLDLLYVHTTDFPMHAWPPGDPRSTRHLQALDELIGEALQAAPDAALFVTADHGMNSKNLVYDLNKAVANRGRPVRLALSAEKDRYVRHHRTFGGTAWVWLERSEDEGPVTELLYGLPGVETVLPRGQAAAMFRLHPDRIGDLTVLGDESTVFGDLPDGRESEVLPPEYRSHGSQHEKCVPLLRWNLDNSSYQDAPEHNKDLLAPLLNTWCV